MSVVDRPLSSLGIRRALLVALLGVLMWLCIIVLRPFIVPIVWAAIIAYTSWPAHLRISRLFRHRPVPAALSMTVLVALIVIGPLLLLAVLLQDEISGVYQALVAIPRDTTILPAPVRSIPWLGDAVQKLIDRLATDPLALRKLVVEWATASHAGLLGILGSFGRNLAKFAVTLVTVFFFFRDGTGLVRQARILLSRLFADRLDRYVHAAGAMVRAVVFGFLMTALAQGLLAGIGYAVVGVDAPAVLGALTILAAIVPVIGTGLVWGTIALVLAINGQMWSAVALFAWGTLLVHPVDNVLRPLLISNATQVPFLLVMFGVIGGIAAFGLVGLFIGPVVLAIATAVWREWLEERRTAVLPPDSTPPQT